MVRVKPHTRTLSPAPPTFTFSTQPPPFPFVKHPFPCQVSTTDPDIVANSSADWVADVSLVHESQPDLYVSQLTNSDPPHVVSPVKVHLTNGRLVCDWRSTLNLLSVGADSLDRFLLRVELFERNAALASNVAPSHSLLSRPFKVVKHCLSILSPLPHEWMRDKGGRRGSLCLEIRLVGPHGNEPVLNRAVPLKLELYYQDGTKLPKQNLLVVDEDCATTINPLTGHATIRCRIMDVSNKHSKRRFRIRAVPDVKEQPAACDVAAAMSNPVLVKSKINTSRIRKKLEMKRKAESEGIPFRPINANKSSARNSVPEVFDSNNEDGFALLCLGASVKLDAASRDLALDGPRALPEAAPASNISANNKRPRVDAHADPTGATSSSTAATFRSLLAPPQGSIVVNDDHGPNHTKQPPPMESTRAIENMQNAAAVKDIDLGTVEELIAFLPFIKSELGRLADYDRQAFSSTTMSHPNNSNNNPLFNAPQRSTSITLERSNTDMVLQDAAAAAGSNGVSRVPTFGPLVPDMTLRTEGTLRTDGGRPLLRSSSTINSAYLEVLANTASDSRELPRSMTQAMEQVSQLNLLGNMPLTYDPSFAVMRTNTGNSSTTTVADASPTADGNAEETPTDMMEDDGNNNRSKIMRSDTMLFRSNTLENQPSLRMQPSHRLSSRTLQFLENQVVASDKDVSKVMLKDTGEGLGGFDASNKLLGFYRLAYVFDPVDNAAVGELNKDAVHSLENLMARGQCDYRSVNVGRDMVETQENRRQTVVSSLKKMYCNDRPMLAEMERCDTKLL